MSSPTTRTADWLTGDEMLAWRSYVETNADLMAALERDLATTGLNLGDYQVLVFLSESPERALRMCDLAGRLQLSPSGLTRRLDGLVRSGLVERRGSDSDRRVMLAALTPKGVRRLEESAPIHVASVRRRMIDLLDADELEVIATVFQKIRTALEKETE
ncbi:MAG TPA: MarR family transcriptional regulator [Ilumatobacteraceae bacterium]|nr:MarR family transcriptional regulator [Ilumatobacteraceae bacterium]